MKEIVTLVLAAGALVLAGCSLTGNRSQMTRHSGIVLDAQRRPVANATVEIYQEQWIGAFLPSVLELKGTVHSDSQGKFVFPVFDPTTVLVAQKAGWAPGLQEAWHLKQRNMPVILILTPPAELAGPVVDEHGQPVADAEVWASRVSTITSLGEGRMGVGMLTGQPARQLFSTRTAADGEFRLVGLPTGCGVNLAVTKPGMAMCGPKLNSYDFNPIGTQCLAGQTNVKLGMEPGANIRGKVIIQTTGHPLGDVTLWLRCNTAAFWFYNGRQPVKSAPDGTFHFGDVPSGTYTVIARQEPLANTMPPWVADPVPVKVGIGQDLTGIRISAVKGGILNVKAVDQANGKPLSGVSIAADKRFYGVSATTGAKGTVQFRLPAGEYQFSAMKDYWSEELSRAKVENGQTSHSQIELNPPLTLRGAVFDPSGAPASNVQVSLDDFSGGTRTDLHGRFELLWNPKGISSRAKQFLFARDWVGDLATVSEIGPTTTNVNLHLQPALALSGLVNSESGKPIAKAQLRLTLYYTTGSGTALGVGSTSGFDKVPYQTDTQGRFTYAVLPQGLEYGINVSATGYGTAAQRVTSAETKTNQLELQLVLKTANLQLGGRVVDAEGKPLAGALLTVTGKGQPYCSSHSDADGHFELEKLCAGKVLVSAVYHGQFADVPAAKVGETNLLIKISTKHALTKP